MIRQIWVRQSRERFAMLYVFEHRGDSLGNHKHEVLDHHDIYCMTGRVRVTLQGGRRHELVPGQDMGLRVGELHEVTALEAGTVTLHRYPSGMPPAYETLDPREHCVSFPTRELAYPLGD